MEISQTRLLFLCVAAFVTGTLLGAIYDIGAILPAVGGKTFCLPLRERLSKKTLPIVNRKIKIRKNNIKEFTVGFSIFIHDMIFMTVAGITVSVLVYRFNDGKWRLYILIFILLGFSLYRKLLRLPVLALAELLRFGINCVAIYIACFVFDPIKIVFKRVTDKCRAEKMRKRILKYSKNEKTKLIALAHECGCLKINGGIKNV